MNNIKLRKLNATVGMFGDFQNFTEVIDYLFNSIGYKKTLDLFGFDGVGDLSEALVDDRGYFDEDRAQDLVIDALDGVSQEEDNPKLDWGDDMYRRLAGK